MFSVFLTKLLTGILHLLHNDVEGRLLFFYYEKAHTRKTE